MVPRSTIAGIAVVLIAAWGVAMPARPDARQADARVGALIASLGTRYWDRAVDDLVAIGEAAVGPLIAHLRGGTGGGRPQACLALARIGAPAGVDAVHDALASPDSAIRSGAATALGFVRSERSVTALIGVVTKETGQVRRAAVAALGAIGDPRGAEALAGVLRDPAWYIREEAARALGRTRSASSVGPLVGALADANGLVRQTARSALAAQGNVAVTAVAAALEAPLDIVRWQAAWVLGHVDAPAVVEPLLQALESGDVSVRVEAAVGLARVGRRSSRDALAKRLGLLLASPDSAVREEAAWVLSELKTPGAATPLAEARPAGAGPAAIRCAPPRSTAVIASGALTHGGRTYRLYPETLDVRPEIPSPLTAADGTELVVAVTGNGRHAIVPVTLKSKLRQCGVTSADFPTLAATGLHVEAELGRAHTITGRSVPEITELARPGRLSDSGFLGIDEDIVSVLQGDNRIVRALGLTHPDLARPLFHVLNMMQTDVDLGRWNMAEHRWGNISAVISHGRTVTLTAGDTKGIQASIFDDGIEGSYTIEISGALTEQERGFLKARYGRLDDAAMDAFVRALTHIRTGEIQPHYVTWYGFYEGTTPWRTDPVALAFIFGLRTLEQIEAAFPGRLYEVVTARYVPPAQDAAPLTTRERP